MKKLLLSLIILGMIGCSGDDGKDNPPIPEPVDNCVTTGSLISEIQIDDIVDGDYRTISNDVYAILNNENLSSVSIYETDYYYSKTYQLDHYDSNYESSWCYYYSISVDIDNKVTSIYHSGVY